MKPAPFDYVCPDTVDEALSVLAREPDAKLMAGGQSLLPMMNFRVVKPSVVIDISRLLELDYVRERNDGGLTVGALTRHRVLETSPIVAQRFPVISEAMRHVAHLAIRNRGTIGGSLSHADPAAELPMLAMLLNARVVTRSLRGNRDLSAEEFFLGPLTTALDNDEMVVRIELPGLQPGTASAFDEVARRPGDFAMAAVGVTLQLVGNHVVEARVALMGVGETPMRSKVAESLLLNQEMSEILIKTVSEQACEKLTPRTDLHASSDYRKHLACRVMSRVLKTAWGRANKGKGNK